uniref:Uncharacterized protein LOC104228957 n=1 Tax=Nicotiana sylvestris TaxID=4096 RepID=A0A1U7WIQ1_NICSY|nr:PREDICTED: uncharacterized protein LOC104228957 [Nicotiana sylvestris]
MALLATQFAVEAGSPTRSPTTSPVIHHCRGKTLRMLLTRSGNAGSDGGSDRRLLSEDDASPGRIFSDGDSPEVVVRNKLKDLFVSSPENSRDGFSPEISSSGGSIGSAVRRIRPLLLRRVWRPMFVNN